MTRCKAHIQDGNGPQCRYNDTSTGRGFCLRRGHWEQILQSEHPEIHSALPLDLLPNVLSNFNGRDLLNIRLVNKTWSTFVDAEIIQRVLRNPSVVSFNINVNSSVPALHKGAIAERSGKSIILNCVPIIFFKYVRVTKERFTPTKWAKDVCTTVSRCHETLKTVGAAPWEFTRNRGLINDATECVSLITEKLNLLGKISLLDRVDMRIPLPKCDINQPLLITCSNGRFLGRGSSIPTENVLLNRSTICLTKPITLAAGWTNSEGHLDVEGQLTLVIAPTQQRCLLSILKMEIGALISVIDFAEL